MKLKTFIAAGTVAAAVGVSAQPASALTGTFSASAFAAACAAGPVDVTTFVKVEGGIGSSAGGCTVNIPTDARFEIVNARLTFGGPLVVNGASKSQFEVVESAVVATTVTANLNEFETSFKVDKGGVRATAGDINVTHGEIGKTQLAYGGAAPWALQASGAVNISGGQKMYVELNQSRIQAASVSIILGGVDGLIKSDQALVSTTGAISFTSTGAKGLLESHEASYNAGGALTIGLAGPESTIKSSGSRFVASGAVSVKASDGAFGGLIELGGPGGVITGDSVTIAGSVGGEKGVAKVSLNNLTANGGAVSIATGQMGTTEVKEARLTAATNATIATAVGGVCKAELTTINAPASSICA